MLQASPPQTEPCARPCVAEGTCASATHHVRDGRGARSAPGEAQHRTSRPPLGWPLRVSRRTERRRRHTA
eukprot:10269907-Alexandrium_andersonii.AAC.1